MSVPSAAEWEQLPVDPDPERDLGYSLLEWDVVEAKNGSGQLIFLPSDEELLRDDAFIVASESSVCDVDDCR